MNRKSVLLLCQFFYPEKVSSATLPFDTAKGLIDAGFEVGVMCGYPKEYLIDYKEPIKIDDNVDGIKIHRLKYRTLTRKNPLSRLINYFSFTFKALKNIRRIKQYDFIIVYSNPPILPYVAYRAHKKYGTKIIFVSYDVYPEIAINTNSIKAKGLIAKLMRFINKKLFPCIDRCVVLSSDMKEFIEKNRNITNNRVVVIPNWYEKDIFVPRVEKEKFRVTYLGNLGICQDVDTILRTALLLKGNDKIEFVIGGHGNKLESIKKFVRDNSLENIVLKPFLTGDEYICAMEASDCFVITLEKELKGLCYPSKYYSYLANGRPVIAISEESGLTKEIEDNRLGYWVKNGDSLAFAGLIKKQMNIQNSKDIDIFNYSRQHYSKSAALAKYCDLLLNIKE